MKSLFILFLRHPEGIPFKSISDYEDELFKKETINTAAAAKSLLTEDAKTELKEAIVQLTGGATPLGAEYQISGTPFLRVQNIMQNYFSLNDVVYISKNQNKSARILNFETDQKTPLSKTRCF